MEPTWNHTKLKTWAGPLAGWGAAALVALLAQLRWSAVTTAIAAENRVVDATEAFLRTMWWAALAVPAFLLAKALVTPKQSWAKAKLNAQALQWALVTSMPRNYAAARQAGRGPLKAALTAAAGSRRRYRAFHRSVRDRQLRHAADARRQCRGSCAEGAIDAR
jgi:hypothetical protein